ncbi:hypothetical protein JCM10213_007019 [Rhodosporidiobolus nylandii]
MSTAQPVPRPAPAPPTAQEIERKLGSPTLPPSQGQAASASVELLAGGLGAGGAELQRRLSGSGRRQNPGALSSGDEEEASPPLRPVAHLSAISETEDAVGSGSESDASSIGGRDRSRSPGRRDLDSARTSRDSGGLSENVALKSGYLMKKGEKRKTWKKRWFVLRGAQLAMYKTDEEYRLLRLIPITDIHSVSPVELKKHAHAFGIVTPRRTYYVEASSPSEVHSWCQLIDRAKTDYRSRATVTSLDAPSTGRDSGTATGQQTPVGPTPVQTPRAQSHDPLSGRVDVSSGAIPIPASSSSVSQPMLAAGYSSSPSALAPSSYASTTSSLGAGAPPHSLAQPAGAGLAIHTSDFELQSLDAGVSQLSLGAPATSAGGRAVPQRRNSALSDAQSLTVPSAYGAGMISSSEDEDGLDMYEHEQQHEAYEQQIGSPGGSYVYAPPIPSPALSTPPAPLVSTPAAPAPAPDPNKVILSGYLMKQGKRKNWRKRWFVLQSGMLMYSRSHMDTKLHRQIPLTSILDAIEYDATAHSTSKTRNPLSPSSPGAGPSSSASAPEHCFKIITPKRTYLCCAPSEEDEIKWLAALQCLVARRTQAVVMGASLSAPLSPPAPSLAPPAAQQPARSLSSPLEPAPSLGAVLSTSPPPAPSAGAATSAPKRSASQSSGSRPMHGRQRSITDAARQAVRDVEKRFHPPAPAPAA